MVVIFIALIELGIMLYFGLKMLLMAHYDDIISETVFYDIQRLSFHGSSISMSKFLLNPFRWTLRSYATPDFYKAIKTYLEVRGRLT